MITSTPDPRKTEYAQFRAAWLNQVRCNRAFPRVAAYKFSSVLIWRRNCGTGEASASQAWLRAKARDSRDLPAETDPAFRGAGDSPGHPRRRPAGQPLSVPDHRRWRGGRAPVGGAKSGPGAPSCAPPRRIERILMQRRPREKDCRRRTDRTTETQTALAEIISGPKTLVRSSRRKDIVRANNERSITVDLRRASSSRIHKSFQLILNLSLFVFVEKEAQQE